MNDSVWIGKTLGDRYQIQELLGEGGMSAVYKAYDPNLRRVVAVKLIHSHLSRDPQFVRRFEEEAAAVAQLRHENIIQVFDFNNDDSTYYIVFEYVPGESLRDRMVRLSESGRTMSQADIINYSASVADALQYAHKRGIIHRDIKPANIMVSVHGQAILTDFGIVKIVGGDTHTATGAVLGTARYISPEQVRSERIDHRTDIYSLGVTIFEMASGQPPFAADSAMTVMMMHVNDPVPDIRTYRHDLPSGLSEVIIKAMAKNPDERYQNASELAAVLRSIDGGQPGVGAAGAAALAAQGSQTKTEASPPVRPKPAESPVPAAVKPSSPPRSAAVGAAASPQAQAQGEPGSPGAVGGGNNRKMLMLGGAGVLLILLLCIGAAAVIFGTGMLNGQDEGDPTADATGVIAEVNDENGIDQIPGVTETLEDDTQIQPTEEPTEVSQLPPTEAPTIVPVIEPTLASSPTSIAQPQATNTSVSPPTLAPTHTPPPTTAPTEPAGLYVQINSIGLQGNSYVVDYTPIGYTPQLPGTHIHFFFNTVPPQNAGVGPTQETWILYGGPNPFTGYRVGDRPSGATQMCTLVANADHTIQLGTGNCYNLP